jgi:hypothetical protein
MTARAPSAPTAPARAGLLRHRDVRLLVAGQAVSELGSQVGSIALPLVAVLGRPELRAITACTALTNLLWAAAGKAQLLILVHQVGLAPAAIGLLFSAGAAGGLLAALAATRAARRLDAARLIWVPVTVTAPFALCTPLTAPGGAWPCCRSASPSPPSARPSTTSARSASGRRCARPSCSAG